jgi:putative peptidoglycan lipid II flippase
MNNILARAFYALGDTKTPMRISVVCLGINLILGVIFIPALKQAGMGIANTLSAVTNTVLLGYALRRALPKMSFADLVPNALSVAGAGLLASLVAWACNAAWESVLGHTTVPARFGAVFVPMVFATAAYGAAAWYLRLPQVQELVALVSRRRRKPPAA